VHHAELVRIGAGTSRGVLAGSEVSVLLGGELGGSGLVPEHVKGLLLGHAEQLSCHPGRGLLGSCYLTRLLEGDGSLPESFS
jgi:hypothetical protein